MTIGKDTLGKSGIGKATLGATGIPVAGGACAIPTFTPFIFSGNQVLSYLGNTVTATSPDAVGPVRNESKSTVSFTGSSSVVHFELFYDSITGGDAELCALNFYNADPNVGATSFIGSLGFKDDAGGSTGDIFNGGVVVTSNVTMTPWLYKIAVDVDLSNSTMAYKDNQGNSGSVSIGIPGFASGPIFSVVLLQRTTVLAPLLPVRTILVLPVRPRHSLLLALLAIATPSNG